MPTAEESYMEDHVESLTDLADGFLEEDHGHRMNDRERALTKAIFKAMEIAKHDPWCP